MSGMWPRPSSRGEERPRQADAFPVEDSHVYPPPYDCQKAGYLDPVILAAHVNTFCKLCFNVRCLAFMEGWYKNHLVEQHQDVFYKSAVEDIIPSVTRCPSHNIILVSLGVLHMTSFLMWLGVFYMRIHTINSVLCLVSRKKFYFCR